MEFTVVGMRPGSRRRNLGQAVRYAEYWEADSSREAEDAACGNAEDLWVAHVFPGRVEVVDLYTGNVDPGEAGDSVGVVSEPFTVVGITRAADQAWNDAAGGGQRWFSHFTAVSARQAEDLAHLAAKDEDDVEELLVCAVLAAHHTACDEYAVFVDPDKEVAET